MTDQQTAATASHPRDANDNALLEALEAWGPLIAGGYECPAAGQRVLEAAERIKSLQAEADELRVQLAQTIMRQDDEWQQAKADRQRMRDALANAGLKFRSIRYHADNGHQDRPLHERLRLISQEANAALDDLNPASKEANDG